MSCGTTATTAACTPCTVPANGTATCNGTPLACGVACTTGYHLCGTGATSTCVINGSTAITSCGNNCTVCTAPTNGTVTCSAAGNCVRACNTGFHLCGTGANANCVANNSVASGCSANGCTACAAADQRHRGVQRDDLQRHLRNRLPRLPVGGSDVVRGEQQHGIRLHRDRLHRVRRSAERQSGLQRHHLRRGLQQQLPPVRHRRGRDLHGQQQHERQFVRQHAARPVRRRTTAPSRATGRRERACLIATTAGTFATASASSNNSSLTCGTMDGTDCTPCPSGQGVRERRLRRRLRRGHAHVPGDERLLPRRQHAWRAGRPPRARPARRPPIPTPTRSA